ncbi:hypothetical protein K443DRAFT_336460 [Laccaria amethystina LaAM-08-1]|uniref:Uncharacterized protein n=1 Tax=Laccaria amethystina LaAM-08-1 TaxID=1095629 RepID=A0A0C9YC35_9AGAR|nr:hypothetical protein K443DRAFT_336460 [Laccaria amethystina LaAM-08-1]
MQIAVNRVRVSDARECGIIQLCIVKPIPTSPCCSRPFVVQLELPADDQDAIILTNFIFLNLLPSSLTGVRQSCNPSLVRLFYDRPDYGGTCRSRLF